MHEVPSTDVRVKQFTLTNTSTTSAKRCTLPKNATIIDIVCHTYATAAACTLDVGVSSNDDQFVSALDVSAAQINRGTVLTGYTQLTSMTDVYAHVAYGGAVAGGPFRVQILFTTPKSTMR
jgi:hypothetical protein